MKHDWMLGLPLFMLAVLLLALTGDKGRALVISIAACAVLLAVVIFGINRHRRLARQFERRTYGNR